MADFLSANHGTIVTLTPRTPAAEAWAAANLVDDEELCWTCGPTRHIEPRMFPDIAYGLLNDGLTLEDAATGRLATLEGASRAL